MHVDVTRSDEVVLCFVTLTSPDPAWAQLKVPNRDLLSFERVSLQQQQSMTVSIPFTSQQLTVVDDTGRRVNPTGVWTLAIGDQTQTFVVA